MNQKLILGILIPAILLLTIGLASTEASIHPTIKITNPQEGDTVSNQIIITAIVENVNIEEWHYGASVQLFIDDKKFKGKGKAVSFEGVEGCIDGCTTIYEWTANSIKNGEHTVTASACHSAGWICYFAAPVTFTVS